MVLVNELGEIGIDHHLVEHASESTLLLENGCLCCAMRDDLKTALKALHSRRARGEIPRYERVVVETTGIADPVPIAYTLLAEPVLQHQLPSGQRRHRSRCGQRCGAARPLRRVGQAGGAGGSAGGEQARYRRARRPGDAARAARDAQSRCAGDRRRFPRSRSGRSPDRRHPRPSVEEPRGGSLDALDRGRRGGGRRPRPASRVDRRLLLHLRCGARLDRVRRVDVDAAAPPRRPRAADEGAAERGRGSRSGACERGAASRPPARASGPMAGRGSALPDRGDLERPRP